MDTPRMYAIEGGGQAMYGQVEEESNINMENLVDLGISESEFLSPESTARRSEEDTAYSHIDKNGEFLGADMNMNMEYENDVMNSDHTVERLSEQRRRMDPSIAEAHEFFTEMDAEFINRTTTEDETFVYAASDVIVQKSLEIPIIVQWANSEFHYEFTSDPSLVKFGVAFVAACEEGQDYEDLEIETIIDTEVVDCAKVAKAERDRQKKESQKLQELQDKGLAPSTPHTVHQQKSVGGGRNTFNVGRAHISPVKGLNRIGSSVGASVASVGATVADMLAKAKSRASRKDAIASGNYNSNSMTNTTPASALEELEMGATNEGNAPTDLSECDVNVVRGSFTVPEEGVVFFLFDIDDTGWLSSLVANQARVTYRVTVETPSFSTVDIERSAYSSILLSECTETLAASYDRFSDAEATVGHAMEDMAALEKKILALEARLQRKQTERDTLQFQKEVDLTELSEGLGRLNGLCVRTLNRHLLSYVLGFLVDPSLRQTASTASTSPVTTLSLSSPDLHSPLSSLSSPMKGREQAPPPLSPLSGGLRKMDFTSSSSEALHDSRNGEIANTTNTNTITTTGSKRGGGGWLASLTEIGQSDDYNEDRGRSAVGLVCKYWHEIYMSSLTFGVVSTAEPLSEHIGDIISARSMDSSGGGSSREKGSSNSRLQPDYKGIRVAKAEMMQKMRAKADEGMSLTVNTSTTTINSTTNGTSNGNATFSGNNNGPDPAPGSSPKGAPPPLLRLTSASLNDRQRALLHHQSNQSHLGQNQLNHNQHQSQYQYQLNEHQNQQNPTQTQTQTHPRVSTADTTTTTIPGWRGVFHESVDPAEERGSAEGSSYIDGDGSESIAYSLSPTKSMHRKSRDRTYTESSVDSQSLNALDVPDSAKLQLSSMVQRMNSILEEKGSIKRTIKVWVNQFADKHHRPPTSEEKQQLMGGCYGEYSRLSKKYRSKMKRLQRDLERLGLDCTVADQWLPS